ncbi:hypothetical protein DFH27DRAFT_83243 [Peziza echinospora]|nr:hypothetical protein DFH27DRAFT_83243 [Peziza echinospora]
MKRHTTTTTTTNRFSILPLLAVVVSLAQSSLQSPSSSPPLGKAASNEKFIRYAEEVGWDRGPRSLWTRQTEDLIGSWSLRSLSCPQDTQDCGKPKAARACCPNSSICTSYIYAFYCCPTKNSCLETAQTLPRCGDPNWSLWRSRPDNFFCCL